MLRTKVILIVAAVLLLALGFYSVYERNQKISLANQLEALKIEQNRTQIALKSTKQEIERLSEKLRAAENQINTLNQDLTREQLTRRELMSQLDGLRQELEKQVYQKMDLERQLAQAKEQMSQTQEKLQKLEIVKQDLEAKIKQLEELSPAPSEVELGQIVVSSPQSETQRKSSPSLGAEQSLKGSVLVINKEYNFAVINLGIRDGLKIGDTLSVLKNKKNLGEVKIEKIQEGMSAVNFISSKIKDKLTIGEEYEFKLK